MWKVQRSLEAITNKTNQINSNQSFISPSLQVQFDTVADKPQQFNITIFSDTFSHLLESEIKERLHQCIYKPYQIFPLYNYTKSSSTQVFEDDLATFLSQTPQMITDLNGTLSPIQWLTKYSHNTTDTIPSLDFFSDVLGCKDLTELADLNLSAAKIQLSCIATLHNSDNQNSIKIPFGNTFQFKDFWPMPEENHGVTLYQILPNSSSVSTQINNLANILSVLGAKGITVPFDLSVVCSEIDQDAYNRLQVTLTVCIQITTVIYCLRKFEIVVGLRSPNTPFTKLTKTEDIDWHILNKKNKYALFGSVFNLDKVANETLNKLLNQEMFLRNYQHYMRQIISNTKDVIARENISNLDGAIRAMKDGLFTTDKIVDVYTNMFIPNIKPYVEKYWNDTEKKFYSKVQVFMKNIPF